MHFIKKYWWTIPLVLLLLIYVFGDALLSKYTRKAFNSSLKKAFGQQYSTGFSDLDVSLFTGYLSLTDLTIHPRDPSSEQGGLRELYVDNIRLNGYSIWNIFVNDQLDLQNIHISNIDVLIGSTPSEPDTSKGFIPETFEFMGLEHIGLDKLRVDSVRLRKFHAPGDTLIVYKGSSASMKGLEFVKAGKMKLKPEFDHMLISLKGQRYGIKQNTYLVHYDSLQLNTENNLLDIYGIQISPEKEKFELADSYSQRRDVYDLTIRNLVASGFKFRKFLETGSLEMDSLGLNEPELGIYTSSRLPHKRDSATFPQEGLRQSPLPIQIRTSGLKKASIVYKELHGPSRSNFTVQISIADLQAGPFYSNAKARGADAITLNANGVFQEALPYQLALHFPYETSDTFSFAGSISSFHMTSLNSLLVPLEAVRINEGYCQGVDFQSICTSTECSGKFTMRYENLKIDLLKQDRKQEKGIKSFFANILIRQNNPVGNNVKSVPMQLSRKPHLNFINLLDNSLVTGMRETIKP